ncbi:hypothetical protein [Mycolicibacterium canariasense]|uniref:hypothetical protein n=1 Tax=Mycolicibacterium canariasense TaxID=228230 RepID=UPI000A158F72|nr:hypothetical protein [Mycolicibacterium canariasense]MCV7208388.1 hypothetical protein [Mycolicibacterium canariasense]ORV13570.1 hypothetical protein AWB94_04950 [Mycolicibacterium canariasense]
MRLAITDGEVAELVVLQDDGTRTEVRIEVDTEQGRPVLTVQSTRKTCPVTVIVNGERKLP